MPRSMTLLACFLTPALLLSACGESEEVKALRANHAQLQAQLESTKSELATAKQEGERLTGQLRSSLEAAQTELASTKQALERVTAEVQSLRSLTVLEVRSPNGRVLERAQLKILGSSAGFHGTRTWLDSDGKTLLQIRFTDGKMDDQQVTIRDEDGKILLEGPTVGGWVHGMWTLYTDGRPEARLSFREGALTDLEIREADGRWRSASRDELDEAEGFVVVLMAAFVHQGLAADDLSPAASPR